MYVDILKHLSNQTLPFLFQNTPLEILTLGDRIEFVFHWSKWIESIEKQQGSPQTTSNINNHSLPVSSNGSVSQENIQSDINVSDANQSSKSSSLYLNTILKSNRYGNAVTEYYIKHNELDDTSRKLLAEAVLQFCIATNTELSTSDAESLSTQIVSVFPNELAVCITFFSHI